MPLPTLTRTIELANGQTLQIFNASRKVAGDAWLVKIIFKIEIAMNTIGFTEATTNVIKPQEIKAALGPSVIFETTRERHFIHESLKDITAENLENEYLQHTLAYISKADFPQKFVTRKFREFVSAQELKLKAEA